MSQEKSIIRTDKTTGSFSQIDNRIFNDSRLSLKAKGLIGYLLSKPNNWQVIIADIINHCKDGRDSVYSGLDELVKFGYMEINQLRDEKGRFAGKEYVIYECPLNADNEDHHNKDHGSDTPDNDNNEKDHTGMIKRVKRIVKKAAKTLVHVKEEEAANPRADYTFSATENSGHGFSSNGKSDTNNTYSNNTKLNNTKLRKEKEEEGYKITPAAFSDESEYLSVQIDEFQFAAKESGLPNDVINDIIPALVERDRKGVRFDRALYAAIEEFTAAFGSNVIIKSYRGLFGHVLDKAIQRIKTQFQRQRQEEAERRQRQAEPFPFYNWLEETAV